jgi:hypothetical protein
MKATAFWSHGVVAAEWAMLASQHRPTGHLERYSRVSLARKNIYASN